MPRMRPTRPWLQIAGIVALSLVLVTVTYLAECPGEMNDFEVFQRAGARFLHGESLYQPRDGHFMFKYLPGSAAVFAIFSALPLDVARSGLLAVLATFIKPYAAIIAIYYLLVRRSRTLAVLSAGMGALLLLPVAR